MTGTDPVAVVEELARRFGAGQMAEAMQLFSPGLRIEQPASFPHGGWHEGLDGMAAMGAEFGRHWDRTVTAPRIHGGNGEVVVQVTTQTWTARATGRAATVDVVELMTVRDGLITEIRVFQHDSHLLLGLLDR